MDRTTGEVRFEAQHRYADDVGPGTASTYTIEAQVDDDDGSNNSSTSVVVNNVAPLVTAPADQAVDEGSVASFAVGSFTDAGLNDGPWTVRVNWDDGSAATEFSTNAQGSLGTLDHRYLDSRTTPFTVTVQVTDKDGQTGEASFLVTVRDVAPTVALSGTPTVNKGVRYTVRLGQPVDPGQDTITAYTVSWGDGSQNTYTAAQLATALRQVKHTYASRGLYTIRLDATDEDGLHQGVGTLSVAVLSAQILGPASGRTSQVLTYTATSMAPPEVESTLRYEWAVFNPSGGLMAAVTGSTSNPRPAFSFVPNRAGWYTIRLIIRDPGGGVTTIVRKISVLGRCR